MKTATKRNQIREDLIHRMHLIREKEAKLPHMNHQAVKKPPKKPYKIEPANYLAKSEFSPRPSARRFKSSNIKFPEFVEVTNSLP